MKTICLFFILLINSATHAAILPIEPLDARVQRTFSHAYPTAQLISWEQQKELTKICFIQHDEKLFAYYNSDGEEVAISRVISPKQLPMLASNALKSRLNDKWLTDLFEMTTYGDTYYFATIMDRDMVTIYRGDASGNWEVFRKTKRS